MTEEQNTEALKKARTFSDNKDKIDGFYNGYVQTTIELQKQIQIDAEQIRALQKQNGELTDKVAELEAQIEKMKCCENCNHKNLNWGFSSICEARDKIKIENPLTCKCDKWEIKEK